MINNITKDMKNLYVDKNGRATQIVALSNAKDFDTAEVIDSVDGGQIVRIKAIEESRIRLSGGNTDSDGVLMSEGETEYFYINDKIELISGSINIMW